MRAQTDALAAVSDRIDISARPSVISILTAFFIFVSATLAFYAIAANRLSVKRQAAMDFMTRLATDDRYNRNVSDMLDLEHDGALRDRDHVRKILDAKSGRDKEARRAIREILNIYEILCVGIERNIIDERISFAYGRGILTTNWERLSIFVDEARRQFENDRLFITVEDVVERWNRRALEGEQSLIPRIVSNFFRV